MNFIFNQNKTNKDAEAPKRSSDSGVSHDKSASPSFSKLRGRYCADLKLAQQDLVNLQRVLGNRSVQQSIQNRKNGSPPLLTRLASFESNDTETTIEEPEALNEEPKGNAQWSVGSAENPNDTLKGTGPRAVSTIVNPSVALENINHVSGRNIQRKLDEGTPNRAPLIVADEAIPDTGQMRQSGFLKKLNDHVCEVTDSVLDNTSFSSSDCPYIQKTFSKYRQSSPSHIEQIIHSYAPECISAKSAADYISIIGMKTRNTVLEWLQAKDLSEIPLELSSQIPSMTEVLSEQGQSLLTKGTQLVGSLLTSAGQFAASAAKGILKKMKSLQPFRQKSPETVLSKLGKGERLATNIQNRMERAFGSNFSQVEIHSNETASRLSQDLNARAFTVGHHIAFGPNEYNPGSLVGDALIAHELAHVEQQRGDSGTSEPEALNDDIALEMNADHSAMRVMAKIIGEPSNLKENLQNLHLSAGLSLQRCVSPMETKEIETLRPVLEDRLEIMNGIDPAIKNNRFTYTFKGIRNEDLKDYWLKMSFSKKVLTYPSGKKFEWEQDVETILGDMPGTASIVDVRPVLDEEGAYTFNIDLEVRNKDITTEAVFSFTRTFNVVTASEKAFDELAKVKDLSLDEYQRRLAISMALTAPDNTPPDPHAPHIVSISNNPIAAGTSDSGKTASYMVINPSNEIEYNWYAQPFSKIDLPSQIGTAPLVTHQGQKKYKLGNGPIASFEVTRPDIYIIEANEIKDGKETGVNLIYNQNVSPEHDQADVDKNVEKIKEYYGAFKEATKEVPEATVQVKAVHVDSTTGAVTPLNLYVGKKGSTYIMQDYTAVTLLKPDEYTVTYKGDTIDELIESFDDKNKYPKGKVALSVGKNSKGVPQFSRSITTDGESFFGSLSSKFGIAGLILGIAAIAAAPFTGGESIVVTVLIISSITAGVTAGALSIADNLQRGKVNKTQMAVDIASIAASILGAGPAIKAARSGSMAIVLANQTTRFLLISSIALDVGSFLLISVDGIDKISEILDSNLSDDVKMQQVIRILANLVVSGGLMVLSLQDLKGVKKRLTANLGSTLTDKLDNSQRLILNLLDDEALKALQRQNISKKNIEKLIETLSKDPSFATRGSKNMTFLGDVLNAAKSGDVGELDKLIVKSRLESAMSHEQAGRVETSLDTAGVNPAQVNQLDDAFISQLKKIDDAFQTNDPLAAAKLVDDIGGFLDVGKRKKLELSLAKENGITESQMRMARKVRDDFGADKKISDAARKRMVQLESDDLDWLSKSLKSEQIDDFVKRIEPSAIAKLKDLDSKSAKKLVDDIGNDTLVNKLAPELGGSGIQELHTELGKAKFKDIGTEFSTAEIKTFIDDVGIDRIKQILSGIDAAKAKTLRTSLGDETLKNLSGLSGKEIKDLLDPLGTEGPSILKWVSKDTMPSGDIKKLLSDVSPTALVGLMDVASVKAKKLLDAYGKDLLNDVSPTVNGKQLSTLHDRFDVEAKNIVGARFREGKIDDIKGYADYLEGAQKATAAGGTGELVAPGALTGDSQMVDANFMNYLKIAKEKLSRGDPLTIIEKRVYDYYHSQLASLGLPELDLRSAELSIAEAGPAKVTGHGVVVKPAGTESYQSIKGLPGGIDRSTSAYQNIMTELKTHEIGGAGDKGVKDRIIVADSLITSGANGTPFVTTDAGIVKGLFKMEYGPREMSKLGGKVQDIFDPSVKNGFKVNITLGRDTYSIIVIPLASTSQTELAALKSTLSSHVSTKNYKK